MVKISPSILSSDFSKLAKEIKSIEKAGAELVHLDVMDGHFVDNISFGPALIKSIRKCTNMIFDVHLMIDNVDKYIQDFIAAGADIITFHIENTAKPLETINMIKSLGCKVGIAVKPNTKISTIKKYLNLIDLVLIMSVEPGFSGQTYISQEKKIKELSKEIEKLPIEIEVDGGINEKISPKLIKAGATILVAGSYIFKSKNYKKAIKNLRS